MKKEKETKNKKRGELITRFMIRVYKMKARESVIFISSMSFFFILGIVLILVGVYFNNNIDNAYSNVYDAVGIALLILTLLIVTFASVAGNYGAKLFKRQEEAEKESIEKEKANEATIEKEEASVEGKESEEIEQVSNNTKEENKEE